MLLVQLNVSYKEQNIIPLLLFLVFDQIFLILWLIGVYHHLISCSYNTMLMFFFFCIDNSNGGIISVGEKIRLPDDVTIGYIIEHILSKKLTVINQFHSHLESMALLSNDTLPNQVSIS